MPHTALDNHDTPRTQAERTAAAAAGMIDAAINLLNREGIAGTTLKAIGESAGYSRGLATHHFGSKAGLFRQVLRQVHAEFITELQRRVGKLTGARALHAASETHRDWLLARPERVRAMQVLWCYALDPGSEFKPNVARFMDRQTEAMAEWIRGGQRAGEIPVELNAKDMATQFYATLIGISQQWLVNPELDLHATYRSMQQNILCLLRHSAAR